MRALPLRIGFLEVGRWACILLVNRAYKGIALSNCSDPHKRVKAGASDVAKNVASSWCSDMQTSRTSHFGKTDLLANKKPPTYCGPAEHKPCLDPPFTSKTENGGPTWAAVVQAAQPPSTIIRTGSHLGARCMSVSSASLLMSTHRMGQPSTTISRT